MSKLLDLAGLQRFYGHVDAQKADRDDVKNLSPVNAVKAAIVSIPDAAPLDAESVVVSIEPSQSGSSDPSPENVRPITGWTGANVVRTGKNLFDESSVDNIIATNRYAKFENGRIHFKNDGSGYCYSANTAISLPAGTYKLSLNNYQNVSGAEPIWMIKIDNGSAVYPTVSSAYTLTLTSSSVVNIRITTSNTTTATEFYGNVQLESGSTATAYEPYRGNTYSITFPAAAGTVYGGTLDLTNGKLVVDRAGIILDGTQNIIVEKSGTDNWYYNYRDTTLPYQFSNTANDICSHYPRTGITNSNTLQGFTAASDWIRIRWGTEDTAENFKTWLSSNPVTVVGCIDTPVTYDIDPVAIALLRGHNAIWADCGDTEIQYRQDVAILLSALISPDETDMIAGTNYAADSFFTISGALYKATSAIATGETIIPGTNCVQTTIAEQLTAIYAALN